MTTAAGSIHRLDGPSGRTGRGVTTMARIQFRTSWRPLLAWPTGLVGFLVITGVSLRSLYPTAASVKEYAAAFSGGTAYAVVNGTPYGIDTLPGVINYEFGFLAGIGLPLMGLLLANRLTRAEEESGRVELVRAGHVSRSAPLTSAVLLLTISLVAVGVGGLVVMLAYGARLGSAAAYGVGLTALGLFFAALTALVAQVVSHARTVVGVSLATLAVTYLVRGVGDLRDSWITYLSPIGWTEQVRAFMGRVRSLGMASQDVREIDPERPDWAAMADFLDEYLDVMDSRGLLDYSELVSREVAFAESPRGRRTLRERYELVLVDENQDTDPPHE